MSGSKRSRQSPDLPRLLDSSAESFHTINTIHPTDNHNNINNESSTTSLSSSSTSFRNVSACNRCRLRKNRCDQNLPACSSCEKAHVKCVGYDPITKREIPRAYVYYLESRVTYLEALLSEHGIQYAPSDNFDLGTKPTGDPSFDPSLTADRHISNHSTAISREPTLDGDGVSHDAVPTTWDQKQDEADKLNKLVSNIGMVSVQGASDPRYLGSTSGISFARVVFAAVKSSVSGGSSDRNGSKVAHPGIAAATNGPSMRDSFFGLQSKPTIKQAPFPDRELGIRLVRLYFEHANPQIPILHRGEFMTLFDRAYSTEHKRRSPRELYMLNIVFAIGAGIILGESESARSPASAGSTSPIKRDPNSPKLKRQKLSAQQHQPEEYHASAMVHLESFLGSMPAADRPNGFGGGLEELQAVLLLAGFALLRPVAPGLWYIVGVAVRLGVDLGLHYEDGTGIDGAPAERHGSISNSIDPKERGRREWVRDLRRRLWWCVYSFDRLVSTCVGRPFGITDQVITTEFPSVLDDNYITTSGFTAPEHAYGQPSYKRVAHHYFRLRLLQSEILQVLQYRQAQQARDNGKNRSNDFMHTKLPNPFLQNFDSFHAWRKDIDNRLWEWKESAPRQEETTVQFSVQFLELNYWQAMIMLYRQSLSVPPTLAGEVSPSDEIASPMSINTEEEEDDDEVFLKVAEAGQKVLKLYRQLHRIKLVNYTFLATHHLFMAGIAFLYAIWHSGTVRSHLTLDDVDFTVLAATSVLKDLMEMCPPAEACRDAFDRMSKATIQMCLSTTGFGSNAPTLRSHPSKHIQRSPPNQIASRSDRSHFRRSRQTPRFDPDLRDLFPEGFQEIQSAGQRWHLNNPSPLPPQSHPSNMTFQDMNASTSSSSIDPSLQPPRLQTQPSQSYAPSPAPTNFTTTSSSSSTANGTYNDTQGQYQTHPSQSQSQNPYTFRPDIDFLNDPIAFGGPGDAGPTFNGHSGLHLGFDSEHDFSDGAGLDLFDSFFFGGGGSMSGAAGGGGSGGFVFGQQGLGSGPGPGDLDRLDGSTTQGSLVDGGRMDLR